MKVGVKDGGREKGKQEGRKEGGWFRQPSSNTTCLGASPGVHVSKPHVIYFLASFLDVLPYLSFLIVQEIRLNHLHLFLLPLHALRMPSLAWCAYKGLNNY